MTDPHDAEDFGQEEKAEKAEARGKPINGLVMFLVGLFGAMVVSWLIYPPLLYSKKYQPFDFNHAVHTEEYGFECDECHRFTDEGRFTGAPEIRSCLMCHTWTDRQNEDNEAETRFLEEFVNEDDMLKKDAEWLSYLKQPDCVYFSHIAHVEMGGMSCEECHGDHGMSSSTPPLYVNRITGYTRRVYKNWKMDDCGDCHVESGVPEKNACFVCHK